MKGHLHVMSLLLFQRVDIKDSSLALQHTVATDCKLSISNYWVALYFFILINKIFLFKLTSQIR